MVLTHLLTAYAFLKKSKVQNKENAVTTMTSYTTFRLEQDRKKIKSRF